MLRSSKLTLFQKSNLQHQVSVLLGIALDPALVGHVTDILDERRFLRVAKALFVFKSYIGETLSPLLRRAP